MHARTLGLGVCLMSLMLPGHCIAETDASQNKTPDIRAIEALKKAGASGCATAKTQMLNFLYNDGEYAYLNQWHSQDPGKHATLTSIAKTFQDGTVMASVVGAPTPGGCDVSFTQVISSSEACTTVRETTFKDWVYSGQMAGATLYDEKEASTLTVALSSQPTGCLVVKTGIFFFPSE